MSSVIEVEPETVITSADEEHHERLWKIKGLQTVVDNWFVELSPPLEIETSDDSPLHSKWTITIATGPSEINIRALPDKTFNNIKTFPSCFIAEFKSGDGLRGIRQASGLLQTGNWHTLTWNRSIYENWNWAQFLDPEGGATVYIKLSLFNASTAENMEQKFKRQSMTHARKNLALVLNGNGTKVDFRIVCSDGKEVKCHKEILKANSPVFKSMLESGFTEAQSGMINVSDIGGATMEILVKYMYTGQLVEAWQDPEITLELTYAAGKYQMTTLLDYLDNVLGNMFDDYSSSSLISLRNLAEKLSLKKAEAKLTERIFNCIFSIKSTDDLLSVFGSND